MQGVFYYQKLKRCNKKRKQPLQLLNPKPLNLKTFLPEKIGH